MNYGLYYINYDHPVLKLWIQNVLLNNPFFTCHSFLFISCRDLEVALNKIGKALSDLACYCTFPTVSVARSISFLQNSFCLIC